MPTDELRTTVETMASVGLSHELIAGALKMALKTLKKYYMDELNYGKAKVIARVSHSVIKQAMAGNIAAAALYLRTQAGWIEEHRTQLSGDLIVNVRRLADGE